MRTRACAERAVATMQGPIGRPIRPIRRRIGGGVLVAALAVGATGAAGATAAAAPVAAAPCPPTITALPLPAGAVSGTVLAAVAEYAAGTTAGADRVDHATLWHLGAAGWTVRSLAAVPAIGRSARSVATGVNARGQVVITSYVTDLGTAFSYDRGTVHQLRDAQGGTVATAEAVSDTGVIVGETRDPATGAPVATRWPAWSSAPVTIGVSDHHGTFALAIDGSGAVAGQFGSGGTYGTRAVVWPAGGSAHLLDPVSGTGRASTALDTDTAAGLTVGDSLVSDVLHPVVWDAAGVATVLPLFDGEQQGHARSVSRTGVVVGTETSWSTAPAHAFLWPGRGQVRTLLPLARDWSAPALATVVDDQGTVYGASARADDRHLLVPTVWTCARQQSYVPVPTPPGRGGAAPAEPPTVTAA